MFQAVIVVATDGQLLAQLIQFFILIAYHPLQGFVLLHLLLQGIVEQSNILLVIGIRKSHAIQFSSEDLQRCLVL